MGKECVILHFSSDFKFCSVKKEIINASVVCIF